VKFGKDGVQVIASSSFYFVRIGALVSILYLMAYLELCLLFLYFSTDLENIWYIRSTQIFL